jgi:hypothetical protein
MVGCVMGETWSAHTRIMNMKLYANVTNYKIVLTHSSNRHSKSEMFNVWIARGG